MIVLEFNHHRRRRRAPNGALPAPNGAPRSLLQVTVTPPGQTPEQQLKWAREQQRIQASYPGRRRSYRIEE
jgi:hypothetical protein